MAKNKSVPVEKPLPPATDSYKAGVALIKEAQRLTGDPIYGQYNIVNCYNHLNQMGWSSLNENAVMDFRPFASAWLKLLNHYIESAVWCTIFNVNRAHIDTNKSAKIADEALAQYRKVALAYGVE